MAGLVSLFGGKIAGSSMSWPRGAAFSIIELDEQGRPDFSRGRMLQFFPGEISDASGVTYSSKVVPGASLPIYQWVSGGERTISFSTSFARDTLGPTGEKYEVDVAAAVEWMRSLKQPRYDNGLVYPPPVVQIVAGNLSLLGGKPFMYAQLGNIDVTWKAFFNDGTSRIADVQLSFSEVVQVPGKSVKFYGREADLYQEAAKRYNLKPKE